MDVTHCLRSAFVATLVALLSPFAVEARAQAPVAPPMDEAQKEMIELFGKVENRLREIDKLLGRAGAGDARALSAVTSSGIDQLLKASQKEGQQAVQDIDRILELARQMAQKQQSEQEGGGKGQQQGQPTPSPNGQNPMDRQGDSSTQREETPSTPEPSGNEPKPKPGGERPGDGKPGDDPRSPPKPEGNDPKSPRASNDKDPRNQRGAPPASGAKDAASNSTDARDRWGDLPVHARDVFRNEGGRDMPLQYRDWIDAYYRRLNKKP